MESHSASQGAPSRSGLPAEAYDPIDGVLEGDLPWAFILIGASLDEASDCREAGILCASGMVGGAALLGTIVLAALSYALYRVARCRPGVLRDGDGGA